MRVSVIKREQLMQGMVVAEDVYTSANQLILAHGMVLTPNIIGRLESIDVNQIKVCTDCVSEFGNYQSRTTYSRRVTESDEFRNFDQAYMKFARTYEDYLYHVISADEFPDTDILTEGIRRIYDCASDRVHMLEIIINRQGEEHLYTVHSVNVALLGYSFAKELDFSPEDQDIMILAGLFHDTGRVATPDLLIRKPDREQFKTLLREIEVRYVMCDHINYGYDLLKNHEFDQRICDAARYHHERLDGSGYLDGSSGQKMDIITRLIAIVDMTDMTILADFEGARKNIFWIIGLFEQSGLRKFDKQLLKFCLRRIAELYLHHIVVLSNGIQGEVIVVNKTDLARPIIKTHYGYIDLGKAAQLDIVQIF